MSLPFLCLLSDIILDCRGTLKGDMMIETNIRRSLNLWHHEQRLTFPAQCAPGDHRTPQPIITAPCNSSGAGSSFGNWRDLIRSMLPGGFGGKINVHFCAHGLVCCDESTKSLISKIPTPSPPYPQHLSNQHTGCCTDL